MATDLNLTAGSAVNREFKNSVFTLLLDDEAAIRDVSGALFGGKISPDAKIEKTTLKNVFIGKWRNDLSFLIDNQLIVLIEHQSTINKNMPLRMLPYICETYNKFFKKEDLYAETKKFIPKPIFIVLYNGEKDIEKDYCEYRLSDMFLGFDSSKEAPDLELVVHVYNINKGHSAEMIVRKPNTQRLRNAYRGNPRK
jgi:predicted transposase/invertase (TIGR01784 family)